MRILANDVPMICKTEDNVRFATPLCCNRKPINVVVAPLVSAHSATTSTLVRLQASDGWGEVFLSAASAAYAPTQKRGRRVFWAASVAAPPDEGEGGLLRRTYTMIIFHILKVPLLQLLSFLCARIASWPTQTASFRFRRLVMFFLRLAPCVSTL